MTWAMSLARQYLPSGVQPSLMIGLVKIRAALAALTASALLAELVLGATLPAQAAGGPVNVGLIYSKTGALASYGAQYAEGFAAGLDYATHGTGMAGGHKIVVTERDDASDPAKAVAAAKELIGQGYKIIGGSTSSGAAIQLAPLAKENNVLFVSGAAASDVITGINRNTFRSGRQTYQDVLTAGTIVGTNLRGKKVVVFAQDTAFGQANVNAVRAVLGGAGGEVSSVLAPRVGERLRTLRAEDQGREARPAARRVGGRDGARDVEGARRLRARSPRRRSSPDSTSARRTRRSVRPARSSRSSRTTSTKRRRTKVERLPDRGAEEAEQGARHLPSRRVRRGGDDRARGRKSGRRRRRQDDRARSKAGRSMRPRAGRRSAPPTMRCCSRCSSRSSKERARRWNRTCCARSRSKRSRRRCVRSNRSVTEAARGAVMTTAGLGLRIGAASSSTTSAST